MTRYQIAIEAEPVTPDTKTILELGCLKWNDEKIPVTLTDRGSYVGFASDIRREDGGKITAEITYMSSTDEEDFKLLGHAVFANDVQGPELQKFEPRIISSATIREIFLTLDVPWAPGYEMSFPAKPAVPTDPPMCSSHLEVQHRDRQPPWCNACGWSHGRPAVKARKYKDV